MAKPKRKTVVYTIDPSRGAAALIVGATLEGYTLVKMTRKGNTAIAVYEENK